MMIGVWLPVLQHSPKTNFDLLAISMYGEQRVAISLMNFVAHKPHPYAFQITQTCPTRIQQALDDGVIFAGNYTVMTTGCGEAIIASCFC
jgi:hypothetical protein